VAAGRLEALADRVVVITGASSGIGAATARVLAGEGARVVLGARRADRLRELATEIVAAGGAVEVVPTDLRDEAAVEALIEQAVARFGRLDALVNNAAVGYLGTIAEGRTDEWRAQIETNLLGVLFATRAALRHLLPQGRGDIITMTSASTGERFPYLGVYAATKASLEALSRCLRAEVSEQGIRVMTIEIHQASTEFAAGFDPTQIAAAFQAWQRHGAFHATAPRIAPEDVARAVAFQLAQPPDTCIHDLNIRSRVV
jgi:clavulanate-9-aldehyde reducatase